jgi:hypothetical protein
MHMVALYTVFYQLDAHPQDAAGDAAMEAGLTDRLWTMEEIAELVDAAAPKPGRPKSYKKRTGVPESIG